MASTNLPGGKVGEIGKLFKVNAWRKALSFCAVAEAIKSTNGRLMSAIILQSGNGSVDRAAAGQSDR